MSVLLDDPVWSATSIEHERDRVWKEIGGLAYFQAHVPGNRLRTPSVIWIEYDDVRVSMAPDLTEVLDQGGFVPWAPSDAMLEGTKPRPGPEFWVSLISVGYGWPAVSVAHDYDYFRKQSITGWELGNVPVTRTGVPRAIPTRVVWSGVLAYLGVYALVSWGLVLTPLLLLGARARRRLWGRGVCGRCRYAIGEMTTCPECGTRRPGVA
jgi:hypothetical protein